MLLSLYLSEVQTWNLHSSQPHTEGTAVRDNPASSEYLHAVLGPDIITPTNSYTRIKNVAAMTKLKSLNTGLNIVTLDTILSTGILLWFEIWKDNRTYQRSKIQWISYIVEFSWIEKAQDFPWLENLNQFCQFPAFIVWLYTNLLLSLKYEMHHEADIRPEKA